MTELSNRVLTGCWLIFVGYWIVSAGRVKPTAERQKWSTSMAHRVPLMLGGLLLWPYPQPYPLNLVLTPRTDLARALAAAICTLGLFIAIWARRTLAGNWSITVKFKQGHELVQNGPYRFVRHPIYTGLLLMCMATAMMGGLLHSWVGFLIMCIGFWITLRQEESLMLRHFPDQYPSYRSRVKALIPFVI